MAHLFYIQILIICSLYAYIILHMLLYAANIYFWRRCRINYPFIFGFNQGTELSYQDVFLISTGLAVLTFGTFLVHLHMKLDSVNSVYTEYIELVPLGLLIVRCDISLHFVCNNTLSLNWFYPCRFFLSSSSVLSISCTNQVVSFLYDVYYVVSVLLFTRYLCSIRNSLNT